MLIKIFTYHNTVNYGALLQSRILKNFIKNSVSSNVMYSKYQPKEILYAEHYKPFIK